MNWNQSIQNIPADWAATKGANVKIALLDSGANLQHPAFINLNALPGRRYFVAQNGFAFQLPPQPGNDDVSDARPLGEAHGTACLSVWGGGDTAVTGMVPEATIYMLKVSGKDASTNNRSVTDALRLAIALRVDIIACTMLPRMTEQVTQGELEAIADDLRTNNILFFSTLRNVDDWQDLRIEFPTNLPGTIVCGALTPTLLNNWPAGAGLPTGTDLLFPPAEVTTCTLNATSDSSCSSSYATVAIAALAAQRIAIWKAAEGAAYQRRSRAAVVAELQGQAMAFSPSAMLGAAQLQLFKPVAGTEPT
jgi:subtilisin family serine protease